AVDSFRTLQPTTNEATVNSLSFLSVSVPINNKLAAGFSVYRFLDYHETFNFAPRAVPNSGFVLFPISGNADFTATAFGGSVAYNVTDQLRIGGTIAANQLKADSVGTRNAFIVGSTFPGNPNALSTSNIVANQTSIHASEVAVSGSFGALYKV